MRLGKADGGRMTNEGMKDFLPEKQRAAPIISAVKSVSERTGRSMAQVALSWLRHQTVPVIPIIGARKVSQLQDNLASLRLELSAEQLKSRSLHAGTKRHAQAMFKFWPEMKW